MFMRDENVGYWVVALVAASVGVLAPGFFILAFYLSEGSLVGLEWDRLGKITALLTSVVVIGCLVAVPVVRRVMPWYRKNPDRFTKVLIAVGCLLLIIAMFGYATFLLGFWAVAIGLYLRFVRVREDGRSKAVVE